MALLTRRRFLVWISSAVPIALVARRADALASAWIREAAATLRALAEAVLPSQLGARGAERVVREFERWLAEYPEGAELVHGYGTSVLRFARPSPRARWAEQLEQLERRAAARRSQFAKLPLAARQEIVRDTLKSEKLDRMPDVASAPHVAVALMAFYFGSREAADLCHEANIGRETCRPLSASPRKPLPLAGARRS